MIRRHTNATAASPDTARNGKRYPTNLPSVEERTRLARRGAKAAIAWHHAMGNPVVIEENGELVDWMPDGRKLPHDLARYAPAHEQATPERADGSDREADPDA